MYSIAKTPGGQFMDYQWMYSSKNTLFLAKKKKPPVDSSKMRALWCRRHGASYVFVSYQNANLTGC